jgi:hypothetical protein
MRVMASFETRTRRFSRAEYEWRYARREVFDASARVTPLAAPGSSLPVSHLLP